MMARIVSMGFQSGPHFPESGLVRKFNEDHIHKYLDYTCEEENNEQNFRSSNRWFNLAYVGIFVGLFIFLVVYLTGKDKTLLYDLIKFILGFAAGTGAGYVAKAKRDKPKET